MPDAREIVHPRDDEPPAGASPWVGGASPQVGIEVVAPDPSWPEWYAEAARRIRGALGPRVLELNHVGSTSVPGLPAKPLIDVDLVVADPDDEDGWLAPLQAHGFTLVVREPWWYGHRCLRGVHPATNLHVFGPDSPEIWRHRIFRDHLRANADDLAAYRDAKLAAAETANAAGEDTMDYNARKEPVIREIYERAFRAAGLLRD